MDSDAFYPFQALWKRLKQDDRKQSQKRFPAPLQQSGTGSAAGKREEPLSDSDDQTLFLAAVENIKRANPRSAPPFFPSPFGAIEQSPAQHEKRSSLPQALHRARGTGFVESSQRVERKVTRSRSAAPLAHSQETMDDIVHNSLGANELALFAKAMQGVEPIMARGREVVPGREKKSLRIPPAVSFAEQLANSFEFAIQCSDEYLEGSIVGLDPLVMSKLRAGSYSPEAYLDLHGKNAEQAEHNLMLFVKHAYYRNMRTLLVITGRGKNSPDGVGVLRSQLQDWLTHDPFKRVVLAFCSAQPCDGGAGAVYILLRKFKKGLGKIRWERMPGAETLK